MSKKQRDNRNMLLLISALLLPSVGCAVNKTSVTASNVPCPVIVGSVERIGGQSCKVADDTRGGTECFDIKAKSYYYRRPQFNQGHADTDKGTESSDKFGYRLRGMADETSDHAIVVDKISFGATYGGWWFYGAIYGGWVECENWVGIEGGLR